LLEYNLAAIFSIDNQEQGHVGMYGKNNYISFLAWKKIFKNSTTSAASSA